MKERLEMATNIVVIIVACIIGGYFLKERLAPNRPPAPLLKAGDHLSSLSAYNWKAHDRTLVLALKKGCHFCEDSMPFYRRLADLERSNRTDVHLVAVFPDDASIVQQLVQSEQFPVETMPGISLDRIKVAGTPTLILVDQQGRVSKIWMGKLSPSTEADVVAAISKPTHAELKPHGLPYAPLTRCCKAPANAGSVPGGSRAKHPALALEISALACRFTQDVLSF